MQTGNYSPTAHSGHKKDKVSLYVAVVRSKKYGMAANCL